MRTFTDEQFIKAFKTSTSIRQVLKQLNLKPAGGNYKTVNNLIEKLQLNTSHFSTSQPNKNLSKRPIEDYLSNKYPINSFRLKQKLLSENIFKPICSNCQLSLWLNQPIPLELDHIDGNNQNNQLNNLRLLCPNCHAQTSNYRGKNIKNKKNICVCGRIKKPASQLCITCYNLKTYSKK